MRIQGSFAEFSKDLKGEIEQLEKYFTVETAQLKKITDHFVKELTKGLSVQGGSIVSLAQHLNSVIDGIYVR